MGGKLTQTSGERTRLTFSFRGRFAKPLKENTKRKVRDREGAIGPSRTGISTRGARALPRNHAFTCAERPIDPRTKYKTEASANTIPVTKNSRSVALARIQTIARIASAGTIFIPGKLNGLPSERTSRCTKNQQAAQQSRYINNPATFESTASFSNVPLIDSAKASVA